MTYLAPIVLVHSTALTKAYITFSILDLLDPCSKTLLSSISMYEKLSLHRKLPKKC